MGDSELQMFSLCYIINDRPKEVQAKWDGVVAVAVVRESDIVSARTKAGIVPNQLLFHKRISLGGQSLRCRIVNRHVEEAVDWANFAIAPTEHVGSCMV